MIIYLLDIKNITFLGTEYIDGYVGMVVDTTLGWSSGGSDLDSLTLQNNPFTILAAYENT